MAATLDRTARARDARRSSPRRSSAATRSAARGSTARGARAGGRPGAGRPAPARPAAHRVAARRTSPWRRPRGVPDDVAGGSRERYLLSLGDVAAPAPPLGVPRLPQAADVPRLRRSGRRARPNPRLAAIGYEPDDPPRPAGLAPIRPDSAAVRGRLAGRADGHRGRRRRRRLRGGRRRRRRGAGARRAGPSSSSRPGRSSTRRRCHATSSTRIGRLYLNYGLLSTWDGAITMLAGSARRRRDARQLDDVPAGARRGSARSGRATTASRA